MIAKESRQALALQRFAEANPQLLEEIRELDAREQAQQIEWAFEDAAEEQAFSLGIGAAIDCRNPGAAAGHAPGDAPRGGRGAGDGVGRILPVQRNRT